jgi:hypothetical protein
LVKKIANKKSIIIIKIMDVYLSLWKGVIINSFNDLSDDKRWIRSDAYKFFFSKLYEEDLLFISNIIDIDIRVIRATAEKECEKILFTKKVANKKKFFDIKEKYEQEIFI